MPWMEPNDMVEETIKAFDDSVWRDLDALIRRKRAKYRMDDPLLWEAAN